QDINVMVIADSDFLSDRMWAQVSNMFGQPIIQAFASNADFVMNSLDNLAGSADLISIRTRGRYARPFTRVLELQREADERLRQEETRLLDALAETEQQLAALNQGSTENGALNPEQEAEIDRFIQQQLATRRQLREVQHRLNEDIDRLGAQLKLINTTLIPVLLVLLGLFMGYLRRQRSQASRMAKT
ncbi:MAG: ABC transporter, partial [Pseudomonadales bacterium]|nr:ABC transporter [Pseudomonadales bacterium]